VETLTCLGNTVSWYDRDDDGEGRLAVHAGADGQEAVAKATRFVASLQRLREGGLAAESVYTLLCTYAHGCVTHLLRANYEETWVDQLDSVFFGSLEHLGSFTLDATQRLQATLRLKDGGCAFPAARATAARAYLGSWALVFRSVATCLGTSTVEGFRVRCPRTTGLS
jgi:hypothetical protein